MGTLSPDAGGLRRPHPLAQALIERLAEAQAGARILDFGSGSGRNSDALLAAGFTVDSIPDRAPVPAEERIYDAAISTHALLHGTPADTASALASIAAALREDAPLYATFASTRDARFGRGKQLDEHTFAPESGDEAGVPHVYFNETQLRALLSAHYEIESLEERHADAIVGRWAHSEQPAGTVHWFAILRRR
jgi:hypothetical protein